MSKGEVEGSRSPRWAVWSRMIIRNKHGEEYLARLRIVDTPWFGIYLHHITGVDPQPDPHDHPWSFLSVVLRGGYREDLFIADYGDTSSNSHVTRRRQAWGRWSIHHMACSGVAHRIIDFQPGTITLILRGPRRRSWGFWLLDESMDWKRPLRFDWVDWKEYVD